MSKLLEQIRADANERFLFTSDTHPSEELARYKRFLRLEAHRLKFVHRAGGGGREVCRGRAEVADLLLSSMFHALQRAQGANPNAFESSTLVATGGYGRAELNPFSDIDVMLLEEKSGRGAEPHPWLDLISGGLFFDLGLKIGHSVRNIEDCVKEATRDLQIRTSLIEARFICGSQKVFERMQRAVIAKCVKGHENAYIEARIADQAARRAKHGNAVCLQEPNIKHGCGGLRDYQNLLWMAFFKYRTRSPAGLEERGVIGADERIQLDEAYDFLLRVRTELHYHTGRASDVLTRAVQPAVAYMLGYTNRSPSRRLEEFMRNYYLHARNIYLITRTIEQRLRWLRQPRRLPTLKQFIRRQRQLRTYVLDGFQFVAGEVYPASERIFLEQPARLMRAFRYAQQRGAVLHPDLIRLIRQQLGLVDKEFLANPHIRDTFLEILNQRGDVAATLRTMHEVGLLGRYLPAFGRLTCLVQHEFFHQFTTDEHTLNCIEKLDKIWGSNERLFARYAEIFQRLERPFVLYLALLLHDAGKANRSPNHAETGGRIAMGVARRLDLDAIATHALALLIRHHLTMVLVSQRRDLDDPGEIRRFAAQVENVEQLNLLTLLTLADSLGTSDRLWNSFKDALLWTLYRRTYDALVCGGEYLAVETRQREQLAEEVTAQLPAEIQPDEVEAHFAKLPPRYFRLNSAPEIIDDIALVHRFMHRVVYDLDDPLSPVTNWRHEPDRGYSQVKVCTWDRTGLFSKIAGALTVAEINILSAEIFTREDDIVLDTFSVNDPLRGEPVPVRKQEAFELFLRGAMAQNIDVAAIIRDRKVTKPLYVTPEEGKLPTSIHFDNTTAQDRTILEIETEDRVGLLCAIVHTLAELDVNISVARICTERLSASDTFYVNERSGGKIESVERQRAIEQRLRAVIHKLG